MKVFFMIFTCQKFFSIDLKNIITEKPKKIIQNMNKWWEFFLHCVPWVPGSIPCGSIENITDIHLPNNFFINLKNNIMQKNTFKIIFKYEKDVKIFFACLNNFLEFLKVYSMIFTCQNNFVIDLKKYYNAKNTSKII